MVVNDYGAINQKVFKRKLVDADKAFQSVKYNSEMNLRQKFAS